MWSWLSKFSIKLLLLWWCNTDFGCHWILFQRYDFLFYKSDDVKEDYEEQNWANEAGSPGHNNAPVGHGFPDVWILFTTALWSCSLALFTCSSKFCMGSSKLLAMHLNSTYALQKESPREMGEVTAEDILESLPTTFTAGFSIGIVYSLAQ